MIQRIDALENAIVRLEYQTQIWVPYNKENGVYGRSMTLGNFRRPDNVLLKKVVELLMDKLGVSLELTQPTQSNATLKNKGEESDK